MKTVNISSGFESAESLQLFSKVLNTEVKNLPAEAYDIHGLCLGNPFLISLIASNLKEYSANNLSKWQKWVTHLTHYK